MKQSKLQRPYSSVKGFTIIEVLIVLAIVGLIILLIFLALTAAQRVQRNEARKVFAGQASAQLQEYAKIANGAYPDTQQEQCRFIIDFLADIGGGLSSAVNCSSPPYDGARDCVLISTNRYDICFHARTTSSHHYPYTLSSGLPYDEISIQLAHFCGQDPSDTDQYPIKSEATSDSNRKLYSVWTPLETNNIFCLDNK